jgi:hypothetical protein
MGHSRSQDLDILLEGSRGHVLALLQQPDATGSQIETLIARMHYQTELL